MKKTKNKTRLFWHASFDYVRMNMHVYSSVNVFRPMRMRRALKRRHSHVPRTVYGYKVPRCNEIQSDEIRCGKLSNLKYALQFSGSPEDPLSLSDLPTPPPYALRTSRTSVWDGNTWFCEVRENQIPASDLVSLLKIRFFLDHVTCGCLLLYSVSYIGI